MAAPLFAGIAKKQPGAQITDLSAKRNEMNTPMDLLFTGI